MHWRSNSWPWLIYYSKRPFSVEEFPCYLRAYRTSTYSVHALLVCFEPLPARAWHKYIGKTRARLRRLSFLSFLCQIFSHCLIVFYSKMGKGGRIACIAVPYLWTIGALVAIIFVGIGSTDSDSATLNKLYFMRVSFLGLRRRFRMSSICAESTNQFP